MCDKIQTALERLQSILPLQENQNKCDTQVKRLHQQLIRSFVQQGRILARQEMAAFVNDVSAALELLHQYDMVTFSNSGEPIGAYPFIMSERGHSIRVNGHEVQAMCALDALAVGPMFQASTHITSHCAVTAAPIEIWMAGETVQNLDEVGDTHIGIGWAAADTASCCADSLCMEMIFLRDKGTAARWLSTHIKAREIFTLAEAVQLASLFFVPLLA